MSKSSSRRDVVLALAALAAPAVAAAQPVTPAGVFQSSTPAGKALVVALLVMILAAIVVGIMKVASGPRLAGGSAYLSGLRLGGPLVGFLGAAWCGLNMAIGLANVRTPVPTYVLARGAAEIMFLIVLGLLTGAVAVIANWAVEARIDRAVLKA